MKDKTGPDVIVYYKARVTLQPAHPTSILHWVNVWNTHCWKEGEKKEKTPTTPVEQNDWAGILGKVIMSKPK